MNFAFHAKPLKRQRSFTLLEILIAGFLLSLALGWGGIEIMKAIQSEKFGKSVEEVIGKISLAQEIMIDYGCDVTLSFIHDSRGFCCKIEGGDHITERAQKFLCSTTRIPNIETVQWTGEPGSLPLTFNGGLGVISCGKLILSGKGNRAVLNLPGYPARILKSNERNEEKKIESLYPSEKFSAA